MIPNCSLVICLIVLKLMYEDSGRTRNICCIPFYGKIETNADPNSIGTEAQTSWSLANVGVKVRNKNETAKPFGNFYDFLALLVEISSDGGFSPQTPRCFLVLDYLFSSTRKLQFYVELAIPFVKLPPTSVEMSDL